MITLKEDIAREYVKGRKNMSEEEAIDLLDCVFKYIEQDDDPLAYAYKLPSLGIIYKNSPPEYQKINNFLDRCYIEKINNKSPIEFHNGKTKEQIQTNQNNSALSI